MKTKALTGCLLLLSAVLANPAWADRGCSVRDVAGKWMFATGIGRQMLPGFPPDKDITAIGTMNIARDGSLEGTFDVTVQDTFFQPDIPYTGSVIVNSDCTATIEFVTALGSARTDSVVIVNRRAMTAMSQDPLNLWTYEIRRVAASLRWKRDD